MAIGGNGSKIAYFSYSAGTAHGAPPYDMRVVILSHGDSFGGVLHCVCASTKCPRYHDLSFALPYFGLPRCVVFGLRYMAGVSPPPHPTTSPPPQPTTPCSPEPAPFTHPFFCRPLTNPTPHFPFHSFAGKGNPLNRRTDEEGPQGVVGGRLGVRGT